VINNDIEVRRKLKRGILMTESEKFHSNTYENFKHYKMNRSTEEFGAIDNILDNWEKSMRERKVLNYGYLNILHFIFWWVICRRDRKMRRSLNFRNHVYFEVGQEKLLNELDWVTIIKAIRQLKILTQLLLTKKQKFLIKFQRNNVIDSSSSGTSDEGQLNIIDLMKSNYQKHKEIVNRKIESNIQQFKTKELTEIDVRVIKGNLFQFSDYQFA
jgi:hypothetical protein